MPSFNDTCVEYVSAEFQRLWRDAGVIVSLAPPLSKIMRRRLRWWTPSGKSSRLHCEHTAYSYFFSIVWDFRFENIAKSERCVKIFFYFDLHEVLKLTCFLRMFLKGLIFFKTTNVLQLIAQNGKRIRWIYWISLKQLDSVVFFLLHWNQEAW